MLARRSFTAALSAAASAALIVSGVALVAPAAHADDTPVDISGVALSSTAWDTLAAANTTDADGNNTDDSDFDATAGLANPLVDEFVADQSGPLSSLTMQIGQATAPVDVYVYSAEQAQYFGGNLALVGDPMATAAFSAPAQTTAGYNSLETVTFPAGSNIDSGEPYYLEFSTGGVFQPFDATGLTNSTIYSPNSEGSWTQNNGYTLPFSVNVGSPVTATISPAAPDGNNGWYKTDPVISFTCSATVRVCPSDDAATSDGTFTSTGTVSDLASGSPVTTEYTTTPVQVDTAPPTITPTITNLHADTAHPTVITGFDVHWTCTDATSGVAICPPDAIVSGTGTDTSATGEATDNAGNTAESTVDDLFSGIHAPALTIHGVTPNRTYRHGTVLHPTCTAVSTVPAPLNLSAPLDQGPPRCTGTVTHRSNRNGSITYTYTARATDDDPVGGTAVESVSWTVAAAKATGDVFTLSGLGTATHDGVPQINAGTDAFTVTITGKDGKTETGRPIWIHSIQTTKAGKGTPTQKLPYAFSKVHGVWTIQFTTGPTYPGHYRKFGIIAPDGARHYWVVYVK